MPRKPDDSTQYFVRDLWMRVLKLLHRLPVWQAIRNEIRVHPWLRGIPYWIAAVVVGVVAVLYSQLFSTAIEIARRMLLEVPAYSFVLSPIGFMAATWIVMKYAPCAGGPGIPQVNRALKRDPVKEERAIAESLNLRVALIVVASSLLSVLGGGALGREGPMVHIAACIFFVMAQQFKKVWPHDEHRSWIVAGGAAGVAAAFNAPLAGIVFVLEELAQQHFHQFRTVVLTAVIIAGMVAQWLSGRYLYFGYPKTGAIEFSSVLWGIVIGVCCGSLAFLFLRGTKLAALKVRKFSPRGRLVLAAAVGLAMTSLAYGVHADAMGGGISVVEDLLFQEKRGGWRLLLVRLVGTSLSSLPGTSGGFLAPSLAMGAALGSQVASLAHADSQSLFVLLGMAGFLSAVTKAPFTAWVIVMEMTDRHSAIFPLMTTTLIAFGLSRFLARKFPRKIEPEEPSEPTDADDAPEAVS